VDGKKRKELTRTDDKEACLRVMSEPWREKVAVRFRGDDDWLGEAGKFMQPWRCWGISMSSCGKMKVFDYFLMRMKENLNLSADI
jgi:hypothetical protein